MHREKATSEEAVAKTLIGEWYRKGEALLPGLRGIGRSTGRRHSRPELRPGREAGFRPSLLSRRGERNTDAPGSRHFGGPVRLKLLGSSHDLPDPLYSTRNESSSPYGLSSREGE